MISPCFIAIIATIDEAFLFGGVVVGGVFARFAKKIHIYASEEKK